MELDKSTIEKIILGDCLEEIEKIKKNSIDLILTDPPYNISKSSFFEKSDNNKFNKIKHDFGQWDKEKLDLDILFKHYWRVLKKGGTIIIFYDIWKCNLIKESALKNKFTQPRVCQWVKTNPVPLNSDKNYLSNAIEYFFTFTKGKKPIFNSKYDKGIYKFPICNGKERKSHPTQKPLSLFLELIKKHSKEGDLVLDTFSGTSTTALAARKARRGFIVIEKDPIYYQLSKQRLNEEI